MVVTGCDTTSVCCLRPLYGASCSSLGTPVFSGSHMVQSSGESVSGRFSVSRQCPGVVESSFRSCKEALSHCPATFEEEKIVETIGYRHSTRHDESLNRLCGQPSFATAAAADGMLVPVVARKPAITIAVNRCSIQIGIQDAASQAPCMMQKNFPPASGHPMAGAALVHKGCHTAPAGMVLCPPKAGRRRVVEWQTRPAPVSARVRPGSVSVLAGATLIP